MNNFPAGYFDLNANDNPAYKRDSRHNRPLNNRPAAAIFKIGPEQRELSRMRRQNRDIEAQVQNELNFLERTRSGVQAFFAPGTVLTEAEIDRHTGPKAARQRRRSAFERIDKFERASDYQELKLQENEQKDRVNNLIMGLREGWGSNLTPGLDSDELRQRAVRRNERNERQQFPWGYFDLNDSHNPTYG